MMDRLYSISELAFIAVAVIFLFADMLGIGKHPQPLTVVIICLLWAIWLAVNRLLLRGKQ